MKKIGYVAAECVPFIKVGGLADVVGSLFKIFKRNSYLFLPLYKKIKEKFKIKEIGEIEIYFTDFRKEKCKIYKTVDFQNVIFIGNDYYFDRDEVYGPEGKDYPDNIERFSFFSRSICEICKYLDIKIDVFHCNDWHTSLLPLYLKLFYNDFKRNTKVVFTIHNIAYQGIFPSEKFSILGLPSEYFSIEGIEFYGDINLMKAGIIYSDIITTVSKKFADEIITPEFGFKLDGLLRKYREKIVGIVNGIDYQIWHPMLDEYIKRKYKTLKGKMINKVYLQEELSLIKKEDIPLFSIVSRLVEQKGIDLIIEKINDLMNKNIQIVILGEGEEKYKEKLSEISLKNPEKFCFIQGFNEKLAHQIYASSDFFLMPSRFEPCGLGQMIALKYGSVPVVRKVGGLYDTVKDYEENGWGFTFYKDDEFIPTIERAISVYNNKNLWERLVKKCMELDFSWKNSSQAYKEIYESL
ncbi:MAG: glycogen synthase [Candidatus Omnitrophica bacterium]|nr:glycogen synthase [Candidatus Omnitrophota bacterium]